MEVLKAMTNTVNKKKGVMNLMIKPGSESILIPIQIKNTV
jgi:hypothetical protein